MSTRGRRKEDRKEKKEIKTIDEMKAKRKDKMGMVDENEVRNRKRKILEDESRKYENRQNYVNEQ